MTRDLTMGANELLSLRKRRKIDNVHENVLPLVHAYNRHYIFMEAKCCNEMSEPLISKFCHSNQMLLLCSKEEAFWETLKFITECVCSHAGCKYFLNKREQQQVELYE